MIQHQCSAFDVRQAEILFAGTQFFNHFQRISGTRIVNHRKIDAGNDDFSGLRGLAMRMLAKNLFGYGMTHRNVSSRGRP